MDDLYSYERDLIKQNITLIAGVDEVGRGPLVGPVVAAADEVNIYEATKLAMKDAINKLSVTPEHVLIDAMPLDIDIPRTSIIKGDAKSLSIAAASVIAKVTRDRMMYTLDKEYPMYNFKRNKGYPTKEHIAAIDKYGIIKEHRKSFGPVKDYLNRNR